MDSNIKKPKNQRAAILALFIEKPTWNRWQLETATGSSYPPARIAELKKEGIRFSEGMEKGKNRFGNSYRSRTWTLLSGKRDARNVLEKINQ